MNKVWAILFLLTFALPVRAATPLQQIEQFNREFDDATRHMSNAGILALWEEDGISLLPQTPPITGKKAIEAFLNDVMKQLAGAKMESFENQCRGIEISGDWASEWCTEHQVVRLADGKKFDGWGKMLLVLHRGAGGK